MSHSEFKNQIKQHLDALVTKLEPLQFAIGPAIERTGISVALIHESEIFLTACYGEADRMTGAPVTPETVFPVASVTKSFTATALVHAAKEKDVSLDHPIAALWDGFALSSPEARKRLNMIDLLSHRTGLPRHDWLWKLAELSADKIYSKLPLLAMNPEDGSGFRNGFQYNNLAYGAAGKLISLLSGKKWGDWVKERILAPAGMTEVWMNYHTLPARAKLVKPYVRDMECEHLEEWHVSAAASMWATARGMAEWIILQLKEGKNKSGEQILDPGLMALMRTAHNSSAAAPDAAASVEQCEYGLGWFVDTLNGAPLIHHGGAITGLSAHVAFCPNTGVGAVVFVNQSLSKLPRQIAISMIAAILGKAEPKLDRFPAQNLFSEEKTCLDFTLNRQWHSDDAVQLPAKLEGTYSHPAYEVIHLFSKNGKSYAKYFNHVWPVIKVQEGSFVVGMNWIGVNVRQTFHLTAAGIETYANLHPGCAATRFERVVIYK